MQKYGTGQILTEDGEPVRKTAGRALTEDDVREIEGEGVYCRPAAATYEINVPDDPED